MALALSHYLQHPNIQPFLNYDASISYLNDKGDTVSAPAAASAWHAETYSVITTVFSVPLQVPSVAAVLVPFAVLLINLVPPPF